MESPSKRRKKEQPLRWVIESMLEEPSYLEKYMFGCLAVMYTGAFLCCCHQEKNRGMVC